MPKYKNVSAATTVDSSSENITQPNSTPVAATVNTGLTTEQYRHLLDTFNQGHLASTSSYSGVSTYICPVLLVLCVYLVKHCLILY